MDNRVIYKNGFKYLKIADAKEEQERKERRGYSKGYAEGKAARVWFNPSKDATMPAVNYEKLSIKYDKLAYAKGFKEGYYNS